MSFGLTNAPANFISDEQGFYGVSGQVYYVIHQ
jgi:hypothetical protein